MMCLAKSLIRSAQLDKNIIYPQYWAWNVLGRPGGIKKRFDNFFCIRIAKSTDIVFVRQAMKI